MSPSRYATSWIRSLVLVLALASIAAACDRADLAYKECGSDRCVNLQTTVSSIDWLGDGTPPDAVESSYPGEPDFPLQTNVWYEDPTDAEATRQDIVRRLKEAEFVPVAEGPRGARFRGMEWQVTVGVIGSDPPLVMVTVDIVDDDARAAEILAPIVDALGTIP